MTFKIKDGLQVGNNIFVNANLDVNANNIAVGNTVSIGSGTVNSSFFTGTSNTSLYAYGGKSETSLNANSATYATNAQFAYTSNTANYLNGVAPSALNTNSALYANYATYAGIANAALYAYGGKSETSLNANSSTYAVNAQFAYTANVANYLNGKAETALDANTAQYANYATYAGIANASLYSYGGKAETALNANSSTYSTNAQFAYVANSANYLNGVAPSALSTNSATYATNAQFAYTANSANYLNGVAPSALSTNSATYAVNAQFAYTANVANYLNGKAESALDANTAQYLGGFNSAYYTNATNIITGTLAEARLPYRMNQNVRSTDSVTFANGTFTGNITVGGDLILSGNLYSTNVQSLSVADTLLHLGANNPADTMWGGFIIHYNGSSNTNNHTGLIRSPSSKEYILMSTYGDENAVANNLINILDTSFTYANLAVNMLKTGNSTVYSTIDVNSYSGTANNASYAYGKQENQLNVANAVFATTSNNALRFNGKQESQLSVANAVFTQTANNTTYAYGKQESQLSVANAVFATTANNSLYAYGKQESQLNVANAVYSNGANYLNGFNSAYFTNATNISTGTLSWNVLPQGTVNTSSSVTVSNTWTFQDIIINGGIKALNSFGNTNQVLASNGSGGVYWKQDVGTLYYLQSVANTSVGVMRLYNSNNVNNDVLLVGNGTASVFSNSSYVVIDTQDQFVGTVTSVEAGSGLLGGPITDTGSLYVGAGAGISVNQDDVAVNAKEGLIANSAGLWVNTAYFSILSSSTNANNAATLQYKTWEAPGSIGNTTPNDGKFLDLQANTLYVKRYITANDYINVGNTVINSVYFPASANNAYRVFGKNENQLNVNSSLYTTASNNASYLENYTWETPAAIGTTTANTGKFTYANVTSHIAFAGAAHMMGLGKITVSGTTPANIFEFSIATYSGGKLIIEATDTHTNFRHISEMLLSHDNVNVSATEYGVVQTGNTALATFNTDILSGNVRILATPISSNTTTFKVIQNLFLA